MKVTRKKTKLSLKHTLPYILIVGGVVGLISALVINYDKLRLLQDATFTPNCDINPIVSCGSVMASSQSSAFGFPNPIIGLIGFPVVITLGVLLLTGVRFKRWIWIGLQLGLLFGIGFVHWLFFQSVYRINALCPYCMAVWVSIITMFWYVLLFNLRERNIVLPGNVGGKVTSFIDKHHLDILGVWFLIIAFFIFKHFWYYFGQNF